MRLAYGEMPAIRMEKDDHRETATCGGHSNGENGQYRDLQFHFASQGRFGVAWNMDVDDIRSLFGAKYDNAWCKLKPIFLL
jgi:hypothetical protein